MFEIIKRKFKKNLPGSWKQHRLYRVAKRINHAIVVWRKRYRQLGAAFWHRHQYPFVYRRYRYPKAWAKYRTRHRDIRRGIAARTEGISGFCRIYNEENILKSSIQSQLPYYDEMVLVCEGNCTDRSWEICEELQQQYPDRIKIYQYEPPVYPVLSREIYLLPETHPNSLINYYNYALHKTGRRIVAKVDADMIIIDPLMQSLVSKVRSTLKRGQIATVAAIDLWFDEERDEVMIDPANWLSVYYDHYFVHLGKYLAYHVQEKGLEAANFAWLYRVRSEPIIYSGITQFHLKKKTSLERYIFKLQGRPENTLSEAQLRDQWQRRREEQKNRLLSWEQFLEQLKGSVSAHTPIDKLPDPNIYIREKAPEWIATKGRQTGL